LNSLREEHRPAPSPKRPFFKRNHATDDPRLAGELTDTFAKTSPQKRPVMGPRPLSLHGSPIKENKLAPVLPNIYLGETVKIEELEGSNSPRSAPPLLAEFALGKENLDAAVQPRDFDAPESPTPVSRRTAKSTGRRSDLPVLPEIKQEAFFAEQRPDNIQIETDHGPMLSPGLPDSQYLNIFLQANPDGNADLDAFLRAAAFHVAAFRQFGTPLPHIPTSPGVPIVDFQTQQQEVLRDRSTERYQDSVFESTDDSHNDSDDIRAGSYKDKPLPERVECANEVRRASASTADTVFVDAVEEMETLAEENQNAKKDAEEAPVVKKKRSFIRRKSYASGNESVDSHDETPRKRSKSAFDRALDFGSKKNGTSECRAEVYSVYT
jgi:hypothetical protein